MSSPEHKQKIWNMISKIKTCMLITDSEDSDGQMHARPMQLVQDEYDGRLWFFTKIDSSKTDEVQQNHKACVTFSDVEEGVFVALYGNAHITQDKEKIEELWNSGVAPWFEQGKEDPQCALLEVKIKKGEHWNNETSNVGMLYEKAKANLTNQQPDLGEHERFGMDH